MSLAKGEKCSVCQAYLFDDDDVVFCPECGAPHHRECYKKIGHCALEEFHGTEQQYKKPEADFEAQETQSQSDTVVCGMCSQEYDADKTVCPNCHAVNGFKTVGGFYAYDFLGGVDADMDLGQGVTADEVKKFVLSNTHRYIPRFAQIKLGKKCFWNWLAFLFPGSWFLYRKMYWAGALVTALSVMATMLVFPAAEMLNQLGYSGEVAQIYQYTIADFGTGVAVSAVIGVVITLAISLICGCFADLIYRNHVIKSVAEIKAQSDDIEGDFHRKGGVSLILLVAGLIISQYLPSILLSFAGL